MGLIVGWLLKNWRIIGYVLGAIALYFALMSAWNAFTGRYIQQGYVKGVAAQEAIDRPIMQKQARDIAGYNLAISNQKAKAERLLRQAQENILELERQRAASIKRLEKEHADNRAATNELHTRIDNYANAYGLRFRAEEGSVINSGCRGGSSNPMPGTEGEANSTDSATCVVSKEVSARISTIIYDCDTLRDDYKLLYDAWGVP